MNVYEYLLSPKTGVTFRFKSGISANPILKKKSNGGEREKKIFFEPDAIARRRRNVDLSRQMC